MADKFANIPPINGTNRVNRLKVDSIDFSQQVKTKDVSTPKKRKRRDKFANIPPMRVTPNRLANKHEGEYFKEMGEALIKAKEAEKKYDMQESNFE